MEEKPEKKQLPAGVEFRINDDGSVTFINLPDDLIDLVHELNPDAKIACDLPETNKQTATKDPQ